MATALSLPVDFLGVQSPNQIRDLINNSFCFVQHSIVAENGDAEGTPVAILEATAAGLPVVSTRHAGIKGSCNTRGRQGFWLTKKMWMPWLKL